MKKVLFSALFLAAAVALRAQTADEIIAKYIAALGGPALENIKSVKMEAKVTAQAAPGMEIPLSMTIVNKKSLRMDVSVMGMTQTSVLDGDKGWATNPFQGKTDPEPITADQVKEMKDMTDLAGPLHKYAEKGYTVEYLGKEDVEGTEAHKLKLVMSPTKTQYSLIDPESFYEIKNITIMMVDGKEVKAESNYSNFKTIDGITFAHTVEQNNPMMGASVTTFTSIVINPEIDGKIFEQPAKK